mgnify:CR=1 FL=1
MAKTKASETKAKNPAAKKGLPSQTSPEKLQEEIKAQAHQVYLERTARGEEGDEMSDWLTAEERVKQAHGL